MKFFRFATLLTFFFLLEVFDFAQTKDTGKPDWQSVIGGNAASSPKRTSYGFISISEGRIMSACTGNGTVIWRRSLADIPTAHYCITEQDFIYLASECGTKLALYNPDGIMLWQTKLEEKAVADPVSGRDGRVFIAGKNSVSCYGTKGMLKWIISLPDTAIFPLIEMNDGSLLYIPAHKKNGASTGIRISPYGELLEDIDFTAEISTLCSHTGGAVIGFTTGMIGCASVVGSTTQTLWSIPPLKNAGQPKLLIPGNEGFCVLYSDFTLCEYSFKNRSTLWTAKNNRLQTKNNFFSFFDGASYLFAVTAQEQTYTVFYAAAGNRIPKAGGRIAKEGSIRQEKAIRTDGGSLYPIITPSLHLIVCNENWIVSAYSLVNEEQTLADIIYDFHPKNIKNYGNFTNSIKALERENTQTVRQARYASVSDIAASLQSGNYGIREAGYKRRIQNSFDSYAEGYFNVRRSSNTAEKYNMLLLAAYCETTDFTYAVPLFLQNETEPALLAAALRTAAGIAKDPDGKMLASIEHLYQTKKTMLPDAVLIELAEAVYEICHYMGRPAFIKRGKALLSDMLSSGTRGTVELKVRNIMLRFIKLEQN